MRTIENLSYSANQNVALDIHLPEKESFPVFVYFHGGGLERGDKAHEKYRVFFKDMTENGIAVVSVNYRMYPEAKYPDFLEDAAEAVAWVFQNINNYGNAKSIFVGGSSAGGYISQMLCLDDSWLGKHNVKVSDIAGFVLDAGQPTCHFNVLKERGLDERAIVVDECAPLYHIKADREYPPMLIIVSDNDIKNRYEQTMLLVSTFNHFGYEDKVQLKIMNGKHCAYVKNIDEDGKSVFGKLVIPFILRQKAI